MILMRLNSDLCSDSRDSAGEESSCDSVGYTGASKHGVYTIQITHHSKGASVSLFSYHVLVRAEAEAERRRLERRRVSAENTTFLGSRWQTMYSSQPHRCRPPL